MQKTIKINYPTYNIILNTDSPATQDRVIELLTSMGLNDPTNKIIGYDPSFPYTFWDCACNELNQCHKTDDGDFEYDCVYDEDRGDVIVKTVEEFLTHLFNSKKTKETIKLSKDYDAVVYKNKVVVGCQTIPMTKVQEILDLAKKLK